jgi:hypothetical protein
MVAAINAMIMWKNPDGVELKWKVAVDKVLDVSFRGELILFFYMKVDTPRKKLC